MTALLSAHQSMGVPQPVLFFGTEKQRQKYLPRFAKGEISAFALTEPGVGSDPARMETHAEPTRDGSSYILNGCKMWCTNGTRAGVIVVMAKTPPKGMRGQSKNQITAFIVETAWPSLEVVQRCRFMGLRALYNDVIEFHDIRVHLRAARARIQVRAPLPCVHLRAAHTRIQLRAPLPCVYLRAAGLPPYFRRRARGIACRLREDRGETVLECSPFQRSPFERKTRGVIDRRCLSATMQNGGLGWRRGHADK